jgi:hypothetical protein
VSLCADEDGGDIDVILGDQADERLVVRVLHAGVRDDEDVLVTGCDILEAVEGLLDGGVHDRAAHGLHASDGPVDGDLVGGGLQGKGPVLVAVEFDNADPIVGLEPSDREPRDLLGQFDPGARHGA